MGLIVTSTSQSNLDGAYLLLVNPPAIIQPTGNGISAIVEQFPWGPDQSLYTPTSDADRLVTFAPPGTSRLGSGYLAMIKKAWPTLKVVRVTGTTPAQATATVVKSGPTNMLTLTAKYNGAAANSFIATIGAAGDGNSNHFKLTITVTGASGTTTDTLDNLNYSGTGSDSAPDFSQTKLIGAITKLAAGIPTVGSYSFSGGSDGTITSASYVGTQGAGDIGFAQLEGDKTIRQFFVGDPGNSLRSAVNAGAAAHALYMGDRGAYINGNASLTLGATQTDAANYQNINVFYCDPWVNEYDDTTGAIQLVPPASFVASVAAQLPPSTSFSYKGAEVGAMLQGIVSLQQNRGDGAIQNTLQGVNTIIAEATGGFRIEGGVNTENPVAQNIGSDTRSRVIHYIGRALVNTARPFTDAPNVPLVQQGVIDPVERFLADAKNAQNGDPIHTFHVLNYNVGTLGSVNTQQSQANGDFSVPLNIQTSPKMRKIYYMMNIGETVSITQVQGP